MWSILLDTISAGAVVFGGPLLIAIVVAVVITLCGGWKWGP